MSTASPTRPADPARARSIAIEDLIREYVAAWETRDPERIVAHHAEGGLFWLHSGDAGPVVGRAAIRESFAGLLGQFPDLEFVEQELIAGEWGWVVRWRISGTLATPLEVDGRAIEPGARFEVDAIDLVSASRAAIDAKHTYLDWQAALAQMGV